jgi:hypothetical protein
VANGSAIAPANVVILEVHYVPSSIDAESPEGKTVGTGQAWVLTDGRVVAGSWQRATSADPFDLRDSNGAVIELTPGQTFVELAPSGTTSIS